MARPRPLPRIGGRLSPLPRVAACLRGGCGCVCASVFVFVFGLAFVFTCLRKVTMRFLRGIFEDVSFLFSAVEE